jgi:hypothetical protein
MDSYEKIVKLIKVPMVLHKNVKGASLPIKNLELIEDYGDINDDDFLSQAQELAKEKLTKSYGLSKGEIDYCKSFIDSEGTFYVVDYQMFGCGFLIPDFDKEYFIYYGHWLLENKVQYIKFEDLAQSLEENLEGYITDSKKRIEHLKKKIKESEKLLKEVRG